MSLASTLAHIIGISTGILIPGADAKATSLTHSVQQEVAHVYGAAAVKLAADLKVNSTMTGPEKVFAIKDAIVATAKRDGFKGDLRVFGHVVLDVAQAAFRAAEKDFGSDIMTLATSLSSNPLVAVAAELVAPIVQHEADKLTEHMVSTSVAV